MNAILPAPSRATAFLLAQKSVAYLSRQSAHHSIGIMNRPLSVKR